MDVTSTRETLHRVAAHVLGRGRHRATGRFGLRAAPGGFATPAYGDGPEVLRVASGFLVHETAGGATYVAIDGASLGDLAGVADVTLEEGFSVGTDTPPAGDVERPLVLDGAAARLLAEWLLLGQEVLDHVSAALPREASPAVVQLWPEHFDLATHLTLPDGNGVNLGASLGDRFSEDPYFYVGPWSDARPGDAAYWNAPFGAVLRRSELVAGGRPVDAGSFRAARGFLREGLELLGWAIR